MAGASPSSTRTARRQRKCAAFGSPSSAVWRAAKSGSPPARRHELEASLVRLALTEARERLSSHRRRKSAGRSQAPCLFSVARSAAEPGANRLPAALNGQIPQPRAFRAGLLEIARRPDLLAVDGDDNVALLHADFSRGRIVADRSDDHAVQSAVERKFLGD